MFQIKSNLFSLFAVSVIVGCGGSDSDGNAPSTPITDEFVQANALIAQGSNVKYLSDAGAMYEHRPDGFATGEEASYCGAATCFSANDLQEQESYFDAKNELLALDLAAGKTFRYRDDSLVNGVSLSSPVDDNGESRLATIFLNDNGQLSPQRREMIVNAVTSLEEQIGLKLFNDEINDVYLGQFELSDYYENFGTEEAEYKGQNQNLWHGHTYHDDGSYKHNADTAVHLDVDSIHYGSLIEGDSYQELTDKFGVRGAITFSFGTAMATSAAYCKSVKANFSTFPFDGGSTGFILDKHAYISNSNWHFVHLGQNNAFCNNMDVINEEIIIHELAHALGLVQHFDGFGINAVWSKQAAAVLRAIYHHPVATPFNELSLVE